MRHVQGKTPKDMIASIDGILDGLLRKQELSHEKLNKKEKNWVPFNVSGYVQSCVPRDIVCACLSLAKVDIKKAVIVIDEYPKDTNLFAVIRIVSSKGEENIIRTKIEKGINSIEDTRSINKGDKLSLSIEYPEGGPSPKGIWVALRGEQSL